jgi:hypothetical protein
VCRISVSTETSAFFLSCYGAACIYAANGLKVEP